MGLGGGRRVAVAGMGLVTPLGCDLLSVWHRLVSGESGAAVLPEGELRDTGARYHCPVRIETAANGNSRHTAFALMATQAAMEDSGIEARDCGERFGVSIGTSKGGFGGLEEICNSVRARGVGGIEGKNFEVFATTSVASAVATRWGLKGPVSAPVAACATGAHAILIAARMIMSGEADIVIAGATESCITPLLLSGYLNMGVLATDTSSPAEACKPYDIERTGFVIGEGCGVVVLEDMEHAETRGARVRAELKGGAMGEDVFHITAPDPSGRALGEIVPVALDRAGVKKDEIDYLNTHGTGTNLNDVAESRAVKLAFGEFAPDISLSSTKPMTGHLLGAAGSVEFIISVMALEHSIVPPTINLRRPDPECDLDYTPLLAKRRRIRNCVSISSGFGGHIGVLVAGQPDRFHSR